MSPAVLRILDANANRAREALRTLEDHARFALDDAGLSGEVKAIRHDLAAACAGFAAEAILHRDAAGDVGASVKADGEMTRAAPADVATAAGKRAGEALRVIEEYLKLDRPADAALVERLRYRFYDVERAVARSLRPAAARLAGVRLYVLVTESVCRLPWRDVAAAAIDGGADCVQLREPSLPAGELLARASWLADLCRRRGVVSIVNDRPDVARLAGADGVHVGQSDLPATEARKIVGVGAIVGVSTHSMDQARRAVRDGADYVGVGPVFPSVTKPRDILPGLSFAREAAGGLPIPAVAIAGITAGNVAEAWATGVRAVAVTAAVCAADDPRAAAAGLKRALSREPEVG